MPEFIYQMHAARLVKGDKVLLDDVTLAFFPGAKIGVVGPNGAGKSSLLKMMAGLEHPSNGEARLFPGFTVGLLGQEPQLDETKTVLGNVEEGVAGIKAVLDQYNEIAEKLASDYSDELLADMGQLQEQLDHADAWDLDSQLEQAMDALRCPPPDADVTTLSGGERRRVALCRLLLSQPDLLLLDEPTNHLDAESVQWLEQHLEKYPGTVVAVTHDRYFLDNVAQWILELDRGHAYPYEGNYTDLPGDQGVPDQGGGPEGRQAAQAAGRGTGVGAVQPRAPGRPRAGPGWPATRRWQPRRTPTASWTSRRSRSRRARAWAARWSRWTGWPRASVTGCSSRA